MNLQTAKQVIEELARWGVKEFAVCAGARNSPLVIALAKCTNAKVYSFFEERSAAFFMLGRARSLKAPTAVVTTSGTAAAELLPAMVEAYYSGVPLVGVTADRPSRMRGTGAPQTIEQMSLFKNFVESEIDIEATKFQLDEWSLLAPIHVNVRFDEPLLDEELKDWSLPVRNKTRSPAASAPYIRVSQFLKKVKSPLVIVGGLSSGQEREAALNLLQCSKLPAYLEAQSGIRGQYENELRSGDAFLSWALKQKLFDSLIRIGSIPTARVWRDLENPATRIPVLSLSHLSFSGLSEAEHVSGEWWNWDLECALATEQQAVSKVLQERDSSFTKELDEALKIQNSEPSWFRLLSKHIPPQSLLYLGNSLPIREWDLAADRSHQHIAYGNRGANGIDGQISTFLGMCAGPDVKEGWCIVGDLTALYDLVAPWPLQWFEANKKIRIVVVNNSGGMIFHRIFKNALFENQHNIGFEHWAKMWSFDYLKFESESKANFGSLPNRCIVEICPSPEATQKFYDHYDSRWKL